MWYDTVKTGKGPATHSIKPVDYTITARRRRRRLGDQELTVEWTLIALDGVCLFIYEVTRTYLYFLATTRVTPSSTRDFARSKTTTWSGKWPRRDPTASHRKALLLNTPHLPVGFMLDNGCVLETQDHALLMLNWEVLKSAWPHNYPTLITQFQLPYHLYQPCRWHQVTFHSIDWFHWLPNLTAQT